MHLWSLVRTMIDDMENKQWSNEEMLTMIAIVVKAWTRTKEEKLGV